ncbi:MAG: hypothetical protein WD341_09115 [Tistlia sp.]|uniref:hypothetical protein n=1 Tax=Tistlia sp. TaxID=3057121 RepID=UPI0034A34024
MELQRDGNGSLYVEWAQRPGSYKRAWIRHRTDDDDKNWAGTRRYLHVVRCNAPGQIGGNSTDFPIFNDLPDKQILLAFVHSVNAITGCEPSED